MGFQPEADSSILYLIIKKRVVFVGLFVSYETIMSSNVFIFLITAKQYRGFV